MLLAALWFSRFTKTMYYFLLIFSMLLIRSYEGEYFMLILQVRMLRTKDVKRFAEGYMVTAVKLRLELISVARVDGIMII